MSLCWCKIKMFRLNWITCRSIRHIAVIVCLSHYALMASLLTEMSFCVLESQMETHHSALSWLNIASPEGTATMGLFLALMLSNACESHSKWNTIFFFFFFPWGWKSIINVWGKWQRLFQDIGQNYSKLILMCNEQSLFCWFIYSFILNKCVIVLFSV